MNLKNKVWIGLPAYNEEIAIGTLLKRYETFFLQHPMDYEILVYNDGCKDNTVSVAESFSNRLKITILGDGVNRGLGEGLRKLVEFVTVNSAEPDLFVLMDCDDTHHPDQILQFIEQIDKGYDIVIASRYRAGSTVKGVPKHRQFLSLGAAILFKSLHPAQGVLDYTCGYRCYKASLLKAAWRKYGEGLVKNRGFACMVEILLKLNTLKPKIKEIPLYLRYDLKPTESKMDVGSNTFRLLKLLFLWRVRGIDSVT